MGKQSQSLGTLGAPGSDHQVKAKVKVWVLQSRLGNEHLAREGCEIAT